MFTYTCLFSGVRLDFGEHGTIEDMSGCREPAEGEAGGTARGEIAFLRP